MAFKKLKKFRQKAKSLTDEWGNHDKMVEELALELVNNDETRPLLLPYLVTQDEDDQVCFLKIVATLLIYEDEDVVGIADTILKENAPFVHMFTNALREIIEKEK